MKKNIDEFNIDIDNFDDEKTLQLMNSLKQAILKVKPPTGNINEYSPVRSSLKKYKGSLVIFNEELNIFEYY
jgi:hypothetical protein